MLKKEGRKLCLRKTLVLPDAKKMWKHAGRRWVKEEEMLVKSYENMLKQVAIRVETCGTMWKQYFDWC